MIYIVTCANGRRTFMLDRHDAETWAEWGHCCTSHHTITSVAIVPPTGS